MVALSAVSMNNLESFAVENFAASSSRSIVRTFLACVTLPRKNYRRGEKANTEKRMLSFWKERDKQESRRHLRSYISNADEFKNSYGRVLRIMVRVTGGRTFRVTVPVNLHSTYAYLMVITRQSVYVNHRGRRLHLS